MRGHKIKLFIFPYIRIVKDAGNADVMERLKILAEFQGVSEYQVFMASMTKERDIKQRIKDLMRYELITDSIFRHLPFPEKLIFTCNLASFTDIVETASKTHQKVLNMKLNKEHGD